MPIGEKPKWVVKILSIIDTFTFLTIFVLGCSSFSLATFRNRGVGHKTLRCVFVPVKSTTYVHTWSLSMCTYPANIVNILLNSECFLKRLHVAFWQLTTCWGLCGLVIALTYIFLRSKYNASSELELSQRLNCCWDAKRVNLMILLQAEKTSHTLLQHFLLHHLRYFPLRSLISDVL